MNADTSVPHAVVPLILSPAPMPPQSAANRGLRLELPGTRTDRLAAVPMRHSAAGGRVLPHRTTALAVDRCSAGGGLSHVVVLAGLFGLQLGPSEGHIGLPGVVLPAAARVYVEFMTKQ